MNKMKPAFAFAALFTIAFLFIHSTMLAQAKAVAVEPIKDAGNFYKGDKITHEFVIRNDGNAPLTITDVKPACGCTTASFDKTIGAGKTGKVKIVVDAATLNGAISKGITVLTTDEANPKIELTIRANITAYINVKPGYARYIVVQGESDPKPMVQVLSSSDGTSFDVTGVENAIPSIKVSYHEATAAERLPDVKGKQWVVETTLSNDVQPGSLSDYVKVTTNHPKEQLVNIPVSGFVRPMIGITPPTVDFGPITVAERSLTKTIDERSYATDKIIVTSVECTIKGISVRPEVILEGRNYAIKMTIDPSIPKGVFNGKMIIHTDNSKMPVVEVPVKGTIL